MDFGCPHCGWAGDSPYEERGKEDVPVGYGGPAGGGSGGGGPHPGFVVKDERHYTKKYCPECHRPLPKSQQPKVGLTSGQFEQSLGRALLFLILAFAGYYIFI